MATTTYTCGGVNYQRTVFASLTDHAIIVRLTASKQGALSFDVDFDAQLQHDIQTTDDGLTITVKNVEQEEVFKKSSVKVWECRNCGHIVVGEKAPEICPVCAHPQAYFEVMAENY